MKKYLVILVALCGFLVFASLSWAIPIANTAADGFEDLSGGAVYGYYQNSGDFLFVAPGNANPDHPEDVQARLRELPGYESIVLTIASMTITGAGTSNGTWEANPTGTLIDFYAVKAGNAYAMYIVNPAESTGSWSTFDLWSAGYGGNDPLQISHLVGYNPSSVPEPATLILLGLGLLGIASIRRKK